MSSINCEDLPEFAKIQGCKPNSYLNGNRQTPVLTEEFYKNSPEHLLEELTRIGTLTRLFLEKTRSEAGKDSQDFPSMFISETEANSILQAVCCGSEACRVQGLKSEEIEVWKRTISKKKSESLKRGIKLRLHSLSELFSLTPFQTDVLLIGLAPELDGRFAKLYVYLQNDLIKKQPSVGMILELLCASLEEKLEAREYFSPSAPLLRNRLISLVGDGADANPPLLAKFIKLDERIAAFLLNSDEIDPKIAWFSALIKPVRSFDDLIFPDDQKNYLLEAVKRRIEEDSRHMFYFYGPSGTGKKLAAEACCRELEVSLLLADAGAFPKGAEGEALNLILREALLQKGAVFIENFDALWGHNRPGQDLDSDLSSSDPGYGTSGSDLSGSDFSRFGFSGAGLSSLVRALDSFPGPVFLSAGQLWEPGSTLQNNTFISCAFPLPAFAERKQLWKTCLENYENSVGDTDIEDLAARFKLSGGQIRDAVSTAKGFATSKSREKAVLSAEDLYRACRNRSSLKLNSLARKINPRRKWDDLVLAAPVKEQLEEICAFVRHKETVYSEWGFDKKLSLGKGLNILFAGPSGTGKTLAAEIIAGEVGLDLYKIDLSGIVSKYIGETEKNLKKIFGEGEICNAILFFDEADALFGKRSEVNDSHDRYANIEVSYLLQQMEEHEGTIILASNYKKNLDDAFLRRLQFAVEFPIPDEAARKEIWTGMFPENARLGEDVDFNFLSKFKLTGGNIKNIVLLSAVLAADGSGVIGMKEILKGLKREFQKMGKICTPADFGVFYYLVK
ncbi:MAG: family ATPase [Euryarchaeota archaeon]|nr:family ATPase [Euryarchaeota archaeon]